MYTSKGYSFSKVNPLIHGLLFQFLTIVLITHIMVTFNKTAVKMYYSVVTVYSKSKNYSTKQHKEH